MWIRNAASGPLLHMNRLARLIVRPRRGYRALLLHDVRLHEVEALRNLITGVTERHGLIDPADVEYTSARGQAKDTAFKFPNGTLFTFDDGFRANFALAGDVLEPLGVRAVFFVCPGLIDLNGESQARAVSEDILRSTSAARGLDQERCLMSWQELRTLRDRGHAIGCHGMFHRNLASLSASELNEEIIGGADLLAERMGERTPWYAFAFGDIDSISGAALSLIGSRFPICRSGIRGLNAENSPNWPLLADHIDLSAVSSYRQLVMEGGLDALYRSRRKRLRQMMADADDLTSKKVFSRIDDNDQN